jgi:hypothetical protein
MVWARLNTAYPMLNVSVTLASFSFINISWRFGRSWCGKDWNEILYAGAFLYAIYNGVFVVEHFVVYECAFFGVEWSGLHATYIFWK